MKFLLISSPKEAFFTLPPSVSRDLMEGTIAWSKREKQAGRVVEDYAIPGWQRIVCIHEAESADEMAKRVAEILMSAFLNTELYPLADYETTMQAYLENVKKAEQRYPVSA